MYQLLACFLHVIVVISLAIQCASGKRPSIEKGKKQKSKEQMSRGGSKPSKSAKRTKSNKSMQSGKSAKSQSMGLVADPTQSASSSKSAKGSRSPRKIENKMTEDKNQEGNIFGNEAAKAGDQLDLILEPSNLFWKPAGGIKKVEVSNPGNERQAIKVKCTDNDLYRVNPVYAFIEPGQTVSFDIVRNNGGNKNDKLVFLATKASNNDTRPKELFKPGASNAVMVLPLLSVAA
uniref:Major sperm protein n=1 Tax=Ascaris suum TaxID=6253 RepID=Q8ISB8_ASCSU|nr:MSP-domain protein 4 [Ascaris suum]AAP76179.1 MSP-domain protein 4 [Ascaris suum]